MRFERLSPGLLFLAGLLNLTGVSGCLGPIIEAGLEDLLENPGL